MKVSLNTIRNLNIENACAEDPYSYGVDDIVRRIGHQLGAVEEIVRSDGKYDRIVVAKVVSAQPHPDADKLRVCMIDDGGVTENVQRGNGGLVQVVCGAPNVTAGQLVAWLPPGTIVPSTRSADPFTLEAREIRGKMSNGMLGSPRELDITDDHEGILVIDPNDVGEELAVVGTPFRKLYGVDDVIIECENKMFTHRPDCFGMLGVAREIAGIFNQPYRSPKWYVSPLIQDADDELSFEVNVQIPELVPRFVARVMSNVSVGPSPLWMQAFLRRMGVKSVNNIVDLTNYFMLLTGQPLHAFDYDKVAALSGGEGAFIQARMAEQDEEMTLLGNKTVRLSSADMVIATDSVPIALAGVMGGAATEVDETTRTIILECANFDMYAIRRTSMRHGLFTDAVTRFNKGQSPLQNDRVLAKIIDEIQKTTDARVASPLFDLAAFNVDDDNLNRVQITVDFINARLGSSFSAQEVKVILENVEFVVAVEEDSTLLITAPFWRMDIAIPEDVVEEVGRLSGYGELPVSLPSRSAKPAPLNALRSFKQQIRSTLASLGANEVLTYSFVHGDMLRACGVDPDMWSYHIRNAISPDLQYYRTSLTPSLLAKVHTNLKAQAGASNNRFAIFEIGKSHVKGQEDEVENLPIEFQRLAFVFAADTKAAQNYTGSAYYQAKYYLDFLTGGILRYEAIEDFSFPITSALAPGRSAVILLGDEAIGVIGEYGARTRKSLRLPDFCAGFELDIERLYAGRFEKKYKSLSVFPSSSQDITLEVDASITWEQVSSLVKAEVAVAAAENNISCVVEPLDIFMPEESNTKRYSFHIVMTHHQKTLTTDEVSAIVSHVASVAASTINAIWV